MAMREWENFGEIVNLENFIAKGKNSNKREQIIVNFEMMKVAAIIVNLGNIIAKGKKQHHEGTDNSQPQGDNSQSGCDNSQPREYNSQREKIAPRGNG